MPGLAAPAGAATDPDGDPPVVPVTSPDPSDGDPAVSGAPRSSTEAGTGRGTLTSEETLVPQPTPITAKPTSNEPDRRHLLIKPPTLHDRQNPGELPFCDGDLYSLTLPSSAAASPAVRPPSMTNSEPVQ